MSRLKVSRRLLVGMLEEHILKLKENGLTVLLAEQNQKVALNLSDRGYLIDNGVIRYHGSIDAVERKRRIKTEIPAGLRDVSLRGKGPVSNPMLLDSRRLPLMWNLSPSFRPAGIQFQSRV